MTFLENALICIKKVKLSNPDCLPILLLLYIMFAYLMLFLALSNAVCLYNAYFVSLIFADAFCFISWEEFCIYNARYTSTKTHTRFKKIY